MHVNSTNENMALFISVDGKRSLHFVSLCRWWTPGYPVTQHNTSPAYLNRL
jgi:hypothetical protein